METNKKIKNTIAIERRVLGIGGSYALILPRFWVASANVKTHDRLAIEILPDLSLVIRRPENDSVGGVL